MREWPELVKGRDSMGWKTHDLTGELHFQTTHLNHTEFFKTRFIYLICNHVHVCVRGLPGAGAGAGAVVSLGPVTFVLGTREQEGLSHRVVSPALRTPFILCGKSKIPNLEIKTRTSQMMAFDPSSSPSLRLSHCCPRNVGPDSAVEETLAL